CPTKLLKRLPERRDIGLRIRIVLRERHQHAYAPHPLDLLRLCRDRPACRRAAEERDEIAPFHCSVPPVLPTESIAHSIRSETTALQDVDRAYDRSGQDRSLE